MPGSRVAGGCHRRARSAGEDHDVATSAVAIEVQGDLRPADDMVDPVRVDHVADQDRAVVLEQESDRVGLWGAVLADRRDPDDLFLAQPTPHPLAERGAGVGKHTLRHTPKPLHRELARFN